MTEVGPSETYSPTSNDLMLLLTSSHLQHALACGRIAQTDSDVQDVQNSPAISMGAVPHHLGTDGSPAIHAPDEHLSSKPTGQ